MIKKRKTGRPLKVKKTRKKYMNKDEEEKEEAASKFKREVDIELDALRAICNAIEGLDESAKIRTFGYLKSKYGKSFPADPSTY